MNVPQTILSVQDNQTPLAGKAKEVALEPEPADQQVDKDSGQGKGHPTEEGGRVPQKVPAPSPC